METKPANITAQLRTLWGKLSTGRKIAALGSALLILGGVGYVSCSSPSVDYALLYSGLDPEDAGQVVRKLDAMGIRYRLAGAGTTIMIPRDKVHDARLQLASDGLPRGGGVGYEVFDKQSFATTSFVEQVNYRRALQGELSRTIAAIDAVDTARVHIAMGERSVFKDADNPPSASVALRLHGGRKLNPAQVRGIVYLVASSIDGLNADRVVVVDDAGNVLSSNSEEVDVDAQRDLEKTLERRVRGMIEKVVGPGHVSVVVTANMDYSKIERTEEVFNKDKPVVRSEAVTTEQVGDPANVGGIAGARGNLPGTDGNNPNAQNTVTKLSETRNYEVNRVLTRTRDPVARIKQLHVAVLVDYAAPDAEGDPPKPRTKEELEQIAMLAREAAGIDKARGDRIEVHSIPFAPKQAPPELAAAPPSAWPLPPKYLIPAAAGAGLLFIVTVLLLLRRRRKRKQGEETLALPARVADVERAIDLEGSTDELGPATPPKSLPEPTLFARVEQAARDDAQRTARVLQGWLHQGTKPMTGGPQ